jgi:hypothetical protein
MQRLAKAREPDPATQTTQAARLRAKGQHKPAAIVVPSRLRGALGKGQTASMERRPPAVAGQATGGGDGQVAARGGGLQLAAGDELVVVNRATVRRGQALESEEAPFGRLEVGEQIEVRDAPRRCFSPAVDPPLAQEGVACNQPHVRVGAGETGRRCSRCTIRHGTSRAPTPAPSARSCARAGRWTRPSWGTWR